MDQEKIKQELFNYSAFHKLEQFKNYNLNNENRNTPEKNAEMSEYLHNNFDTMNEVEMNNLLVKCIGQTNIKKQLIAFEFKHYIK